MKKMRPLRLGGLLGCSGWLLAILLAGVMLPRLCQRLWLVFPSARRENWTVALAERKRELAQCWGDTRPLIIMAGDSHVEQGDWYGLFGGAFAIRNCGLSGAKIGDVSGLVAVISDRNPERIVLLCGVNNLGGGDSIESCLRDFDELISISRSWLHPRKITVLSVMPVRESGFDRASHNLNQQIFNFDRQLETACARRQVQFVDISSAVADSQRGLSAGLTSDGLHLNRAGYQRIAATLAPILAAPD
jgi:lysophospholipase L1-like esterase